MKERALAPRFLFLAACILLPAAGSLAATWRVLPDGSGDAPTIQAGVDSSAAGDTVLIAPGTYDETVHVAPAKAGLVLLGDGPPETVVIDGDTIAVHVGRTRPAVRLENLTLTGGWMFGGIFAMDAEVEIVRCHLSGNVGSPPHTRDGGGLVAFYHSDVLLEDCVIEGNTGWGATGGALIWEARAEIRRCVFRGNEATWGGGLEFYHCDGFGVSIVEENLFIDNRVTDWGGGIFSVDSSPILRRNTFYRNDGPGNAGIWLLGGRPEITENIVVGSAYGIYCQSESPYPPNQPIVECNLFWEVGQLSAACPELGANLSAAPLFCSEETGDFRLCSDSPAAGGDCGLIGACDVGCGPCAPTETTRTSWGALKGLFR